MSGVESHKMTESRVTNHLDGVANTQGNASAVPKHQAFVS